MTVTKEMIEAARDCAENDLGMGIEREDMQVILTAALSAQPAPAVPDGWRQAVRDLVDQAMHCTVGFAIRQVDITEAMKNLREEAEKVDAMLAAAPQTAQVELVDVVEECSCFGDSGLHASTYVPLGSEREHCDLCGKPVPEDSKDVLTAIATPPADQQENERMKISPEVLAAHAQFGGDLAVMQKAYEWHELKFENERLRQDGRTKELALGNLIDIWKLRADAAEARVKVLERDIRKAGQVAIDELIDRGGFSEASDDDLSDYLTRIVDACVRAALKGGE